jgi:Flp pilus assembly protein TadD
MLLVSLLIALAQAAPGSPPPPPPTAAPRTLAEDRLTTCLRQARTDPATAMAEASQWAGEVTGTDASYPQQCLGLAYTALLRWGAAQSAFLAARDAADPADRFRRAQLGTMAGNAALAEARAADALTVLDAAARDAEAAGDGGLRAMVETDRARALVLQGNEAAAEEALTAARTFDAQSPFAWLLSATLARRQGRLDQAAEFIATAAALAPDHAETALEQGVIAMLSGNEAAAAQRWLKVIDNSPQSEEARQARAYLAQLAEPATPAGPDAPAAPAAPAASAVTGR